jgi:hypothetical protein
VSTAHDRASAPPAAASPESWHAANQRALLAALAEVRVILLRHAGLADDAASEAEDQADDHPRRAGRGTLVDRLDTLAIDLAERLEEAVDRITGEDDDVACVSEPDDGWPGHAPAAAASMPSALATLCATFRLSDFERRLLVLCAGIELDATFPSLCAAAHGDPARTYPTFGLGLAALPQPHWSALAPDAALSRWRLVEVGPGPLTTPP